MDEKLTSKVVMARLHAWPVALTKWNNYDPFIQEGLKPERTDTGRHGPGRHWKHIYSEEKIALHEEAG